MNIRSAEHSCSVFYSYWKPGGALAQKVQNRLIEVIIYDVQDVPNIDKSIWLSL